MSQAFVPSGKVSPLVLLFAGPATAAAGVLGFAYQWVVIINPFAVVNPVTVFLGMFSLGYLSLQAVRLSKVRHRGVGLLLTFAMLGAFEAGAFVEVLRSQPGALGWWESLQARWNGGVPVLGTWWSMSRAWMWPMLVLESGVFVGEALLTGVGEAGRPFCESCRSWARKGRWKCTVEGPLGSALVQLKSNPTLESLEAVIRGGGVGRLVATVGACRCAQLATLDVQHFTPDKDGHEGVGDSYVTDMLLTPRGLERVFSWGERLTPALIAKRPQLAVAARPLEPLGR